MLNANKCPIFGVLLNHKPTKMKVQLKNIVTEVPDGATMLTSIDQVHEGDYILAVWDNPKATCDMEINNRLFGQVRRVNPENGHLVFGGHLNKEAERYNAHTCGFASHYLTPEGQAKPFPHVYFLIRHGELRPAPHIHTPKPGDRAYDLMC